MMMIMDLCKIICPAWVVVLLQCLLVAVIQASAASRGEVYMVTSPTAVAMPIDDETLLSCEMNIAADKFQWRHYPLPIHEASNPLFPLSLGRSRYVQVSPIAYVNNGNLSTLTVKSVNASVAGDYQCLAHYGASVVASTPGRITVTALREFPAQDSVAVKVTEGNTVLWACRPPASNPPAYIDYYRDGVALRGGGRMGMVPMARMGTMLLENVRVGDRGRYTCKANNVIQQSQREATFSLNLTVVPAKNAGKEAPRFITAMKKVYDVKQGTDVFLECAAVGNPVPNVTWRRLNGSLPTNRTVPLPGGLRISNVSSTDDDVYICEQRNEKGSVSAHLKLNYQEAPLVVSGPPDTCKTKEGDDLHLECNVTGSPPPEISWLLNGLSVLHDGQIEAIGNKIFFTPVEKRHAGKLQCFAANVVGIDYGTANLNVIPKQYISTIESVTPTPTRGNKAHRNGPRNSQQMTPPTKPIITRLSDESVMVRWDVPKNSGLEIDFFKIQYRQRTNDTIRRLKWETTSVDIPRNQKCYEVGGLIPNSWYQFRVGAVYSNQDNKFGSKSSKFFLEQMDFDVRNALPIPVLINTEPINSTSIKVYWEKPSSNITVEGYIINYMSASSAGDYNKVTVEGDSTLSFILTHLEADTLYDIKMQSFTTKSGSEFSPIMKNKTTARLVAPVTPSVTSTTNPPTTEEPGEMPKLFILVGVGVVVLAVLLTLVIFVIICHKWKRKKNANNSRAVVEEINHRIPADANDYVMNPKTNVRPNGTCVLPSNRITITANPLADADNKSPTMMLEMACLTAQNNNCTAVTGAASSVIDDGGSMTAVNARAHAQNAPADGASAYSGHHSKHKRRKRNNSGAESSPMAPSENYV